MGAGALRGIEVGAQEPAQGKSRQWRHGERGGKIVPADAGHARMAERRPHRAEHREIAAELRRRFEFG